MKEFEFIKSLKKISPPLPYGIGDDAAVSGDLLITHDLMAEGVHFTEEEDLNTVIDRLFISNISDIAAMGGINGGYKALLGVAIPEWVDKKKLAEAICSAAGKYNVSLIGGDTSFSGKGLFLALTVTGICNKYILRRSGAKPGDNVYISRATGGAQYELYRRLGILNGCQAIKTEIAPECELGETLGYTEGITACTDISDGLGGDLSHIAEASGARIIIEKNALPLPDIPLPDDKLYEYALSSGEEFALLFTASPETEIKYNKPLYKIGKVCAGTGCFIEERDGSLKDISQMGYEHR
ncbi:MAG: thiamine-phosphate kinase [Deferribacteraceae bacterium]|jgi:thiamine-monophosphate kinase|nr:thiamine-phosphate kinase [Deferribacteraceae bacterium]